MRSLIAIAFSVMLLASVDCYPNAAQPGIFQAGGITNFCLLFPQDSFAFRKIQMLDEKICIQLYHGYAVVKGEYLMFNYHDSALKIKVGYPVNASYESGTRGSLATDVFFDQLYALKSLTDDKENTLIVQPVDGQKTANDNNWYIWESTFKPRDTTKITVYFIVNTNNTIVREGYTRDENNGFVYLLETGATWKQPIGRGELKVALMEDLKIKDIRGIVPASAFKVNTDANQLLYRFNNLSPTFEDNIVIVYTKNVEGFDFGYIVQRRQLLFGTIDDFSKQSLNEIAFLPHTFDSPFKVKSVQWVPIVTFAVLVAVSIIGVIVLVWLTKTIIRFVKRQRPSRGTEI